MQAVRGGKSDAEIAAVAAQPLRPGVRPQPRQRRGGEGEAEQQQRGPRGEADHHAHAVDLELPHRGDPDAKQGERQAEQREQPPALEPVLAMRCHDARSPKRCNHQLHKARSSRQSV